MSPIVLGWFSVRIFDAGNSEMKAPQTMISHCFSQHFDGENNINSTISPIKKPQKPTASHQCESKGPFPPGNQALESLIDTPPESLHKAHLWHKNMAFGGNFGTRYPPKYPMKTQVRTQPSYVPKLQDLQKKNIPNLLSRFVDLTK